tara:strand:+ start:900 stop:1052 length:153 start_codon:yes stop_codon:yes gene_type:complete
MEELGIKVSGISKDTKYLVCDRPSSSSKFVYAEENDIQIINEEDFRKIIK